MQMKHNSSEKADAAAAELCWETMIMKQSAESSESHKNVLL